jgi:hypothetical protein
LNRFLNLKIIIETENCIGIWAFSWCCWKALRDSDLVEFISQFSGVEDIDFGLHFVAENSNNLQKLGLEGKFS